MRPFYFFVFFIFCAVTAWTQKNGSLKGVAYDTISRRVLPDATITVLARKDSSLLTFGMTDNAGRFNIDNIPAGEYRLLITHIGYHNSNRFFNISDSSKN